MTQPGDLWTRCSESLREQVSETTWQLWLSGIEPVSFADGVFLLSVPNGLIRERVETRYLPMIEDTLANEVGTAVRGRLEVQEPDEPEEELLGVPDPPPVVERAPGTVSMATPGHESAAVVLDPKFVFDTFVEGLGLGLGFAAMIWVREILRVLSTAVETVLLCLQTLLVVPLPAHVVVSRLACSCCIDSVVMARGPCRTPPQSMLPVSVIVS